MAVNPFNLEDMTIQFRAWFNPLIGNIIVDSQLRLLLIPGLSPGGSGLGIGIVLNKNLTKGNLLGLQVYYMH